MFFPLVLVFQTLLLPMVLIRVMNSIRRHSGLVPITPIRWLMLVLGSAIFTILTFVLASVGYGFVPILVPPSVLLAMGMRLVFRARAGGIEGDQATRRMPADGRGRILAFALVVAWILIVFALVIRDGASKGVRLSALDWSMLFTYFAFFVMTLAIAFRLVPQAGAHFHGRVSRPRAASVLFLAVGIVLLIAMDGPATHHPSGHPVLPMMFAVFTLRLALRCRGRPPPLPPRLTRP